MFKPEDESKGAGVKIVQTFSGNFLRYGSSISTLLVAQSSPTLCNPMDCSLTDCSVHGILQARIYVPNE